MLLKNARTKTKWMQAMAHKNVKNIHEPVRTAAQTKELEEKLEEAKKKNENAKAGSLADKANLVKRFNEGQK